VQHHFFTKSTNEFSESNTNETFLTQIYLRLSSRALSIFLYLAGFFRERFSILSNFHFSAGSFSMPGIPSISHSGFNRLIDNKKALSASSREEGNKLNN